jgi:SAM-dependent methyltransferase
MSNKNEYKGWELNFFDNAKNFRNYQWNLIKDKIKKRILEVGPGNCVFLNRYYEISKEIFLFEPSENLRIKLNSKIENFKEVKLIKEYDNSKYDTIIYLDVIEHIENDQNEILNAYDRLNKDGYLIINVPAFQFLYTDYDKKIGHYRRYSKSSFKKLLQNLNINNFKMSYFDSIGFCLIFFSKYLAVSNKVNFKKSIGIWNFLVPISKLLDFFLSYFIGKSLMVTIKKD